MKEVEVGPNRYSIGKLDALKQFHVARRLVPVLAAFTKIGENKGVPQLKVGTLLPIAEALSKMSDEETEYIIQTCLAVVKRQDSGSWQYVMIQGRFVYQDITMADMVKLTSEAIMENMGDFFAGLQAA